jgi:hypothetical protein
MAATVKLHRTTQDDSEEHEGSEETRRDEIGEGNKETRLAKEKRTEGENEKREAAREGIEESRDEARRDPHDNGEGDTRGEPQQEHRGLEYEIFERETLEFGENEVHEQGELEYEPARDNAQVGNGLHETRDGEDHGVREPDNGTTHPAPPRTTNEAANPGPREHTRFDWATETDQSIGPVPNASDFRPTKPQFPLASPIPAPRLFANPVTPAQPVCTPPRPAITPSNGDVAPSVRTPTTRAPTGPHAHTPSIGHGPRDLSALRSDAPNPWGTLRRRHYHRHSHTRRQFGPAKRGLADPYPTNAPSHNHPVSKSAPASPFGIFETVRHPHGIGPTKPVIRTPVSLTGDALASHSQPRTAQPSSPVLPPLPAHPTAVQCRCGQFVRVSSTSEPLQIPTTQLQSFRTFPIHISNFRLLFKSFSLPSSFFSRFSFLMATRASP